MINEYLPEAITDQAEFFSLLRAIHFQNVQFLKEKKIPMHRVPFAVRKWQAKLWQHSEDLSRTLSTTECVLKT